MPGEAGTVSQPIAEPYLLFLGNARSTVDAKTASGILQWRPERCIGQYRLSREAVDLGLPDMSPAEAVAAGARTLVVGIAPVGGRIEPGWVDPIVAAIAAGLDVAAGLHARLKANGPIAAAAAAAGRTLHDVRHADGPIPIATGRKRTGRRLLTVGTDCALGKKYTALSIYRAMIEQGLDADFRATGQTGILISGGGIAIDAVVADFASGAAESLSPDNHPDHWDVIEGQGSLFHPAYAGVSLALLHGSQPDAIVVCHDPLRTEIDGFPGFPLPTLSQCIARNVEAARLTNPAARCVGIALDTSRLSPAARQAALDAAELETGLPAFDPIATGAARLVATLMATA